MGVSAIGELADRSRIEAFLRRDPALHLYALGDLDDFFWPFTTYHGASGPEGLSAVFLEYRGADPPVLLALEERDLEAARDLLAALAPSLPSRFYCHLSPRLAGPLRSWFDLEPHGRHLKMVLADPHRLRDHPAGPLPVRAPDEADLPRVEALYREAYQGNWFDARMLATGQYRGAFDGDELVGVAGVHVYSERYRVAALGNVTAHPRRRGEGIGAAVTAAVCRSLLRSVDVVGLNVQADNAAAIRCYEKLGFEARAEYDEVMATRR